MAEVTYYFNAHEGEGGEWTNPDNLVDNNLETFGDSPKGGQKHRLTGNNCPGTDLGTITKVEMRVYWYADDDNEILYLNPFWGEVESDVNWGCYNRQTPGWSSYKDLSAGGNEPDPWTWADIQAIDVELIHSTVGKANPIHVAKVELRIIHTAPPPVGGQSFGYIF